VKLTFAPYHTRHIKQLRNGEIAKLNNLGGLRAAMHVYCCLHAACCGPATPERQEIGFVELQRYLYQQSFRKIADLPLDLRWEAVNETLLRIWQKRSLYYKPGAFLAVLELLNVIRPLWSRPIPPLSLEDYIDQPTPRTDDDPLAHVLDAELRQRVSLWFDNVLRFLSRSCSSNPVRQFGWYARHTAVH